MATPTAEQLMSLPPEYLAEVNDTNKLLGTSIVFIVVPTIVYTFFVISRSVYASRNGWETWVLYPISFACVIGLCVIGICEYLKSEVRELVGDVHAHTNTQYWYASVVRAGTLSTGC